MNTRRPDIFRALGVFLGAICFVFVIKFFFLLFTVIAFIIATFKQF